MAKAKNRMLIGVLSTAMSLLAWSSPGASVAGDSMPSPVDCKEFPVPIYPTTTKVTCEKGEKSETQPTKYTAYIDSSDSVEQVGKFYRTSVEASGWKVKPDDQEGPPGRLLIVIEKGKGYASINIRPAPSGTGSSTQIHAYPNGNEG
jgi:hypothetical protein